MRRTTSSRQPVARRNVLKAGLTWGALGVASPFPIHARGEEPVKIGMVEPLSGVYAKLAEAELGGARLALEEVNQSGGILGRQSQLLIEDSANDMATGVAKTRQLIDRDQVDFILGDLNSAVALAMTRVTAEKRKLHIVTGGHIDEITGRHCSWNVFRICKTTTMEANAIADTLVEKRGRGSGGDDELRRRSHGSVPRHCRLCRSHRQRREAGRDADRQTTRFHMTVNLKTAASLNVSLSYEFTARANEVFE